MKELSEEQLIRDITQGGYAMEQAIERFYRDNFKIVYQKVNHHKLTKDQVLDAYSDSIISLKDNIQKGKFKGDSKLTTYFISIFNRKCIDILRKNTTNLIYENELPVHLQDNQAGIDDKLTVMVNLERLDRLLSNLTEICRNVLMDWNDGYSMDEIAERNGLSNAHTARSKRYNCFQQLMELIKEHS